MAKKPRGSREEFHCCGRNCARITMNTSRAEAIAAPTDMTRREERSESRPETEPPRREARPEARTNPVSALIEALPTECDKATMKEVDSADTSIKERTMTKSRNCASRTNIAHVSVHQRMRSREFVSVWLLSSGSIMPVKTTKATAH